MQHWEGLSENMKLNIIKQQLNMWVLGVGWKDVRVPFQRKQHKFSSAELLEELKKIIQKYVQVTIPRPVRAMVPRPSQLTCAKPMPTLGDELCDALEHQRRGLEEEQARLDKYHDEANIPRRTDDMPDLSDLNSVVGKRVGVIWFDEDRLDPSNSVLQWYYGTVTGVRNKRCESCMTKIKWEIGGTESDERLAKDTWVAGDNTLGKGSWKLA